MMLQRRLLRLALEVRDRILVTVAIGLAITATYVAQGVLIAVVLARVFQGEGLGETRGLVVALVVLVAVRGVLLWAKEISFQRTAAVVKERLRDRLYRQLLTLGPGYLVRTRSGTSQVTLVDGVEAMESYFGKYLPQAVVAAAGPLIIVVYLFTIHPVIGLLVLVAACFVPIVPHLKDRILGERGKRHWAAYQDLNSEFLDTMQGITTLKAFNAADQRRETLQQRAVHLYQTTMAQTGISLVGSFLTALGVGIGMAVAVGSGAVLLARGEIELVQVFVVLMLAGECFRPFAELSSYWHAGYTGISAASGVFALLDAEPEVAEPNAIDPVSELAGLAGTIEFEDVHFAYADGSRPALLGCSLQVGEGETVAVVGPSGAGKTTLLWLLVRFFDPQTGLVRVGGVDVRTLSLARLRAQVAVVTQDTYLFGGSVGDNLRLARPDASDEQLVIAARDANAHEFITALPEGYDTLVGERGVKLSGGQRQRLAIARALLKDAPILVLDEATSNVDAASEALIQEAIERVTAERTTLIIAHRMSTVRHADRILVLDDGRVTESGDHGALLTVRGRYARLVAAQGTAS